MYDRFKNQYIIRLSGGKVINFYYKENIGLCATILNKRNMWTESTVLAKDCQRSFSADIDNGDIVHILYQDSKSNLSEILYSDSGQIVKPLLRSIDEGQVDRNPTTISTDSGHYFIYTTDNDGSKLLTYQTRQPDSTFSQPKIIDYIINSKLSYCAFPDSDGNIIIFYQCADSQNKAIGIKKINASREDACDFIALSASTEDSFILGGFCDSSGICHLIWDTKIENKYELHYGSVLPEKKVLENEQIINISDISHANSSIIENDSTILCYWCWENSIYYSVASQDISFSTPEKYGLFDGKQYYCITYKSNYSDRLSKINGYFLPGNFVNGYSLGFTETPVKMPPVKIIGPLVNDITYTNRMDFSEDKSLANLYNRLEALEKKVQKIEIEAAKENISKIKQEIAFKEEIKKSNNNAPMMPGSGFSNVTPEFLKNLGKK